MSSEMVCYFVAFVAFLVKESYISIKRLMTHMASLGTSKCDKIPLLTLVSWVLNSHGPLINNNTILYIKIKYGNKNFTKYY